MLCRMVMLLLLLLAAQQGYCDDEQLPIRLVNGGLPQMGRVEVLVGKEWGTVCDDGFGLQDANVICRMLGYPRAIRTRIRGYFGQGTGQIWVDQLDCRGDEDSIFKCRMNKLGEHDCKHKEDAGVECDRPIPKRPDSMPVRLSCPCNASCNNTAWKRGPDVDECEPSIHVEGIVEVYYDKSWQLISADGWDDADINVVCGQLGYPLGFGTMPLEFGDINETNIENKTRCIDKTSKVIMKKVECSGTERELRFCYHSGWGPFHNPRGEVATVRCGFKPHLSCDNYTEQQVSSCDYSYHTLMATMHTL